MSNFAAEAEPKLNVFSFSCLEPKTFLACSYVSQRDIEFKKTDMNAIWKHRKRPLCAVSKLFDSCLLHLNKKRIR